MNRLKRLWLFLKDKLNIIITSSPQYNTKVISIRRIIIYLIIAVIILMLATFSGVYLSVYDGYLGLTEEIKTLQKQNQRLKAELYTLNQETELLRGKITRLRESNEEIKEMIDVNSVENKTSAKKIDLHNELSSLSDSLPIGGREFDLYYQSSAKLIARTRENLFFIKKELPAGKKDIQELKNTVQEYRRLIASTPGIWPLNDHGDSFISSYFGWRPDPRTHKQAFHEGLDIGVWYNTPVKATAKGKVVFAGWLNGYGRIVKIDHGFGYQTRYAHLNKFQVKTGDNVETGQIIAMSGNTGNSTGPHLHYEVRKDNIPQNPLNYIGR